MVGEIFQKEKERCSSKLLFDNGKKGKGWKIWKEDNLFIKDVKYVFIILLPQLPFSDTSVTQDNNHKLVSLCSSTVLPYSSKIIVPIYLIMNGDIKIASNHDVLEVLIKVLLVDKNSTE